MCYSFTLLQLWLTKKGHFSLKVIFIESCVSYLCLPMKVRAESRSRKKRNTGCTCYSQHALKPALSLWDKCSTEDEIWLHLYCVTRFDTILLMGFSDGVTQPSCSRWICIVTVISCDSSETLALLRWDKSGSGCLCFSAVSAKELVKSCCETGEKWASTNGHCNNMGPLTKDRHSICW